MSDSVFGTEAAEFFPVDMTKPGDLATRNAPTPMIENRPASGG